MVLVGARLDWSLGGGLLRKIYEVAWLDVWLERHPDVFGS